MNYKKTGLGMACLFSIVYTIFFALYVMSLSKINYSSSFFVYFPAIIWGLLGIYIMFNLYFSKPFRHLLKSFTFILGVPISLIQVICHLIGCCYKNYTKLPAVKLFLTFPTIWATEQLISLLVPLTDSIYTFSYYSEGQVPHN